jgi:hypothetical protein
VGEEVVGPPRAGKWFRTPLLFSLCGFQKSSSERLGNRNGQEEALGIEVVFSGLVNHADLTVLESHRIGKGDIDLPLFKGNRIALVLDADQKPGNCSFQLRHGSFSLSRTRERNLYQGAGLKSRERCFNLSNELSHNRDLVAREHEDRKLAAR